MVKVRLQTETGVRLKEQRSTFSTARDIVKSDGLGLRGLNKGLTSTLGRHGVFNMIYFSFYHNVKDAFPVLEDPVKEFCRKFLIGKRRRFRSFAVVRYARGTKIRIDRKNFIIVICRWLK